MELPQKYREDDIVVFKKDHYFVAQGGSWEIKKGHIARIEKIIYETNRNKIGDGIYVDLVLAIRIAEKDVFIRMSHEWASELIEIKQAATVLYGDK